MAKKIIKGAMGIAGGLTAGLFGGKKKKAAEAPVPVMPIADDEAVRRAKRRSLLKKGKDGRASTFLTDESDTFGG